MSASSVKVVLPWMRRAVIPADDRVTRGVFERVMAWDGALREDSVGRGHLHALVPPDRRGRSSRTTSASDLWNDVARLEHWHGKAMHRLVTTSDDRWCDDQPHGAAGDVRGPAGLVTRRGGEGHARSATAPTTSAAWTWGKANEVVFAHLPFEAVGWLRPFFSRRAPHHGNTFSVTPTMRVEGQTVISSYRQIVDVSDFDSSRFVHPLGQSGSC